VTSFLNQPIQLKEAAANEGEEIRKKKKKPFSFP
jgi:hypothetical protein